MLKIKNKSLYICLICLLFGLAFLSACDSNKDSTEGASAFSFIAPDSTSTTSGVLADTTDNSEEGPLSETSVAEGSENPVDAREDAEAELEGAKASSQADTASTMDGESLPVVEKAGSLIPKGDEKELRDERIPIYAQLTDADLNEEPPVPMSVPQENAVRGISGSKVERFFRTLSVNPVTYHYLLLPSSDDTGSIQGLDAVEVYIALYNDMSYMRVATSDTNLGFLQISESSYYQLNFAERSYEMFPGLSSEANELSMEAFRKLEKNAENFISTGKGSAIFFGKRVQFEEFTADGLRYVRYYFIGDVVVGHRSFQDGKITRTVRVYEASNRYDDELFQIPEGMKPASKEE